MSLRQRQGLRVRCLWHNRRRVLSGGDVSKERRVCQQGTRLNKLRNGAHCDAVVCIAQKRVSMKSRCAFPCSLRLLIFRFAKVER